MPGGPPPEHLLTRLLNVYRSAELALLDALRRAVGDGRAVENLTARLQATQRLRARVERLAARMAKAAAGETWATAEAIAAHIQAQVAADVAAAPAEPVAVENVTAIARSLADAATPVHLAVVRVVEDAYRAVIAEAAAAVAVGAVTRREAAQDALGKFAARGVTGFVDKAGRSWDLVSYTEMATRSAAIRASVDGYTTGLAARGHDLVVVSDSPRECEICRRFESRTLSISGGNTGRILVEHAIRDGVMVEVNVLMSVAQARAAGLWHPSCTHGISRFIAGVTEIGGAHANPAGYEARQTLRAHERQIRAAKRRAAVNPTPASRARVRAAQQRLRDHVRRSGAKRQPHREQIGPQAVR